MAPGAFPELRKTAPRHITWHRVKAYIALYKRGPTRVIVKSITEPPPTKLFRTAGGVRKFKRIKLKTTTREVIIVARTKGRKKPVDTEELEELEALEELEELDEEEEEEEEEDVEEEDDEDDEEPEDEEDEDEDEDEEPAPKRSRKKTSTKSSKSKSTGSRASANGKVGTQEVAAHFGTDARTLRMVLRKHSIPKDEDSNRYEWSSLKHPSVIKIGKLLKGGAAKEAKQEGLDKLKAKKTKATKSTGKTSTGKKTTTKRRRTA